MGFSSFASFLRSATVSILMEEENTTRGATAVAIGAKPAEKDVRASIFVAGEAAFWAWWIPQVGVATDWRRTLFAH